MNTFIIVVCRHLKIISDLSLLSCYKTRLVVSYRSCYEVLLDTGCTGVMPVPVLLCFLLTPVDR